MKHDLAIPVIFGILIGILIILARMEKKIEKLRSECLTQASENINALPES